MAEAKKTAPLSDKERLIIQNIFDTQPAKRAQYLKELGYEMNPKDENEYKPIGSDQPYGEIDPGYGAAYKKGGLAGLANEVGLDLGDLAFDTVISGPATAASAAGGALAGSPLGAIGALIGGVGAGASGNYVAEEAKNFAANILLDKDIPMDRRATLVQSAITGVAPLAMKALATGGKAAYKALLETRAKAIKNAVGSNLTNDMVDVMMQDPEKFTVDAVKDANKKLLGTIQKVFGVEDPLTVKTPGQIKGGVFRDKIDPLNEAAEAQLDALSKDPSKNMSLAEVDSFFKDASDKIRGSKDNFELDEDSKRAVQYLNNIRSELKAEFKTNPTKSKIFMDGEEIINEVPGADPSKISLDFKKVYNLAKRIQKDAWDNHPDAPGSSKLRSFTGGDEEGLTKILDQKAPDLANINAERKKIMDAYKFAAKKVNAQNVGSFYTGKDSAAKEAVRQGLEAVDSVVGTNLAKEVETGGVQSFVKDLYNRSTNGGSKSMNSVRAVEAVNQGVKGALAGGGLGYAVGAPGVGAGIGGAAGIVKGINQSAKFADPEYALKEMLASKAEAAAINPSELGAAAKNLVTAGTGGVAAVVGSQNQANLKAPDPWAILDEPDTSPVPAPTSSLAPVDPWSILDE